MVSLIVDIINIVVNVFSFVFVLMSSLSKSFSEYNTPRKDCCLYIYIYRHTHQLDITVQYVLLPLYNRIICEKYFATD